MLAWIKHAAFCVLSWCNNHYTKEPHYRVYKIQIFQYMFMIKVENEIMMPISAVFTNVIL